ncbi:MAG TPA: nuclear transport factor 2 family protein, partial [Gemmatimonadaceae bacterium]
MDLSRQVSALLVVCSGVASAQSPRQVNEQFHGVLTSQYAALSRGDTATLSKTLADDLVWVVGWNGGVINKAQLIVTAAQVQTPPPRFDIDSLSVTLIGGAAVAEYRRI